MLVTSAQNVKLAMGAGSGGGISGISTHRRCYLPWLRRLRGRRATAGFRAALGRRRRRRLRAPWPSRHAPWRGFRLRRPFRTLRPDFRDGRAFAIGRVRYWRPRPLSTPLPRAARLKYRACAPTLPACPASRPPCSTLAITTRRSARPSTPTCSCSPSASQSSKRGGLLEQVDARARRRLAARRRRRALPRQAGSDAGRPRATICARARRARRSRRAPDPTGRALRIAAGCAARVAAERRRRARRVRLVVGDVARRSTRARARSPPRVRCSAAIASTST